MNNDSNDKVVSDSSGENVDKIREILFGNNMREFEQRFNLLETNHKAEIDNLQKSFEQHLHNLDNLFNEKIKSLQTRMQEMDAGLSENINKLDSKLADVETIMQSDLHGQKQDVLNHIGDVRQGLMEQITNNRDMLQNHKIGKQELSALFAELALKASGELDDEASS